MSALHYCDQGSSTPLDNLLSNKESFSKIYHSITPPLWPTFECIVTIHTWMDEAPGLLEKEAPASTTIGGGWAPRKDTTLDQIIKEALDKNASKDSLWRYIYIEKDDLKPVIIFALIYIHWKKNSKSQKKPKLRDDENSKDDLKSDSKLNPEEEVKRWLTAAKQFLVEMLIMIELPPKIAEGIKWIEGKKYKRGKDNEDHKVRPLKQPRIESSKDGEISGSARPCMGVVGSQTQENPQPHPQSQSQRPQPLSNPQQVAKWKQLSGYEIFPVTAAELNEAIVKYIGPRLCYAGKLGPSSESPVRVDPIGRRTGLFSIFLGQTGKNLAKRAVPATTSKDHEFFLPLSHLSDHVLELVEEEDKFDMKYCQGIAIVCLPTDYFLVLMGQTFTDIRDAIKGARKLGGR